MTDPAIQAEDLRLMYADHPALNGLTVTIPHGSLCALLGRNGAGKTTFLESCVGLRTPSHGRLTVLGREPSDRTLRQDVGMMLQDGGIGATVTPLRILRLLSRLHADPWPVADLMERLALTGVGRRDYRRLSGGEQQRVRLAAALIGRPPLLLLDEPAAGMDPPARDDLGVLLTALRDEGATIVMSTHLIDEAERLADHIIVIDRGTCVASGPLDEVRGTGTVMTFRARAGLDLADLSHAAQGRSVRESAPGHYSIDGAMDAGTIAAVAAWIAGQGSDLTDLATAGRGLGDLFRDTTTGVDA